MKPQRQRDQETAGIVAFALLLMAAVIAIGAIAATYLL